MENSRLAGWKNIYCASLGIFITGAKPVRMQPLHTRMDNRALYVIPYPHEFVPLLKRNVMYVETEDMFYFAATMKRKIISTIGDREIILEFDREAQQPLAELISYQVGKLVMESIWGTIKMTIKTAIDQEQIHEYLMNYAQGWQDKWGEMKMSGSKRYLHGRPNPFRLPSQWGGVHYGALAKLEPPDPI